MSWLALALTAACLWTVVSLVDKTFLGRYIPVPTLYLAISGASALIPIVILPILIDVPTISRSQLLLSIVVGLLYVSYTYLYFQSLARSDASVVTNLLLLVPIFSVALGRLLFSESFAFLTYVGIATVVAGVVLTSSRSDIRLSTSGVKVSTAVWLMLISAAITSVDYALQKHLVDEISDRSLFYWSRFGVLGGSALLFLAIPTLRRTLRKLVALGRWAVFPASAANEIMDMTATFLVMAAYAGGTLGLVSTMISVQPALVFVATLALARIKPGLIPSEGDKPYWKSRLAGLLLTLLGVYLIFTTAPV